MLWNLHLFGFNYECFLLTGGGFQRVRTHLYGSLLYYLQIAQRPDEPDTLEAGMVQLYLEKSKKLAVIKPWMVQFLHAELSSGIRWKTSCSKSL